MTLPMTEIEAALTEALHDTDDEQRWLMPGTPGYSPEAEAAAILAHPDMQAIARQAAVGAAVERLEALGQPLHMGYVIDDEGEPSWGVVIVAKGHPVGIAQRFEDAIAAALGDAEPIDLIEHTMTTEPR